MGNNQKEEELMKKEQNKTDCINDAIDALGITRADSNHLIDLWKIHCKRIQGLEFKATDYEEQTNEDDLLIDYEERDKQRVSDLFALINNKQPQNDDWREEQYINWIEQRITQLKRLYSEIELHLRKKSQAGNSTTIEDNH
jgi:hypothetical protein|tara:strand:+ start:338 stop:760 length:423 start_codon:yes stop_codon:yes gene_type:complete